jgi:hypothetical protein
MINDLQHLKAHIRDAVATVTPNLLQAPRKGVGYHLDVSRATNEAHVEIHGELYTQKKYLDSFPL